MGGIESRLSGMSIQLSLFIDFCADREESMILSMNTGRITEGIRNE